jgi:hypothetical protein
MGLLDWLFRKKQEVKDPEKGGYLHFYGLWDWYDSQSKEVQEYLYKSCGYGVNTDSRRLIVGDVEVSSDPEDPYPWTATKFLCTHALNASKDRNQEACKALLDGAFNHAKSKQDSIYYGIISQRITEDLQIYPDQKEVSRYKGKILTLIRENPGILQLDIKKHYPLEAEGFVGYALSQLKYEEKIRREKKGRSFQLWVIE